MKKKNLQILLLLPILTLTACGNTKKQENKAEVPQYVEFVDDFCDDQAGVTAFYAAYLKGDLSGAQEDSLMDVYFTKPMLDKIWRQSQIINANVLYRAQDVPLQGAETLEVKPLGGGWFMVHFFLDKDDALTETNIPVKAEMVDGQCRITYITPNYNGQQYGDSLLEAARVAYRAGREVSQASAEAFVKDFYKVYAAAFSLVDESLSKRLAILRAEHLSNDALMAYDRERTKRAMDIDPGYDWLIHNSDFDPMWFGSLRVTKLGHYRFMVMYEAGRMDYQLTVTVKRQENRYVIDKVEV